MELIVIVVIVIGMAWGAIALDRSRAGAAYAPVPTIQYLDARVRHVIDCGTVVVAVGWDQLTLRLKGIDCPEDGQPWDDAAKHGLSKLIGGQIVRFEEHGFDKYGRTLATVHARQADGKWMNVNARMVALGHAWVRSAYCEGLPAEREAELRNLQHRARSGRVGLWNASNPVPPWKWRNGNK